MSCRVLAVSGLLFALLLTLGHGLRSEAAVLTWDAGGNGTSWNQAANWDNGGADQAPAYFDTLNITTPATIDSVYRDTGTSVYQGGSTFRGVVNLNQGTIDLPGLFETGSNGIFNIGDGTLTAGVPDAIVNVNGNWRFDRHDNGTFTVNVKPDGQLIGGTFQNYSGHPNRKYVVNVDGGLMTTPNNWNMGADPVDVNRLNLSDGATVSVGSLTVDNDVVTFLDPASTFTAGFGGSFADIDAVNAAVGSTFFNPNGLGMVATDNGDGTYSMAASPIPPTSNTAPGGFQTTASASDLAFWVDANDDASFTYGTGNEVDTWTDKSANGITATRDDGTSITRRTDAINGMATVDFTGANYFSLSSNVVLPTTGSGSSAFVVAKTTDETGGDTVMSRGGANIQFFRQQGTGVHFYKGWPDVNLGGDPNSTTDRVRYAAFNNDPSSQVRFFVNGTSAGTGNQNANNWSLNRLGGGGNCCGNWVGDIAEVVLFTRQLNTAEQQIIENALSAKYGTVTANDLYTGDDPAFGDNDLDVFGIGQIDPSNSVSAAGSAGFGFTSTSLDDGDFLMAGHNTPENTLVMTDVPDGVVARWDRVWFIDETGDVDDATFAFDFIDAGLTVPNSPGVPIGLLYSPTDSPFDFSLIAMNPIVQDGRVTFDLSGINLADGYYTLAMVPEPSSLALTAFGLFAAGLFITRRRRRTN